MKKFLFLTLFIVFTTILIGSPSVRAQTRVVITGGTTAPAPNGNLPYTPLEPIPGITGGNNDLTTPGGFAALINAVFKIMITAGALLAVLMLTLGGVQYMTSSSVGNKTQGLDRAKAAMYGMILIAATYLILNTINPHLLNFAFIVCPGGTASCGTAASVTPSTNNSNPTVNGGGTALGTVGTVGTISGSQMNAVNASLGLTGGLTGTGVATDQVLVYNPADLSSTNTAAINAFTSACQDGSFGSSLLGHTRNVAIVPGDLVGASGESAMVCIAN